MNSSIERVIQTFIKKIKTSINHIGKAVKQNKNYMTDTVLVVRNTRWIQRIN